MPIVPLPLRGDDDEEDEDDEDEEEDEEDEEDPLVTLIHMRRHDDDGFNKCE
jgi:hypothetical protein